MAKEHLGRTKATATKTLYAVMKEISRRGGSMPAKELYPFVEANVTLTEWEREPAGKNKYIRWTNSFQFYSINYAKAGLIVKQKGMWYLTPEGENALKLSPDEVMEKGEVAYREWRKLNPRKDKTDDEPTDENAERDRAEELNLLESDAREGIRQFIIGKSPYEFRTWWPHCSAPWAITHHLWPQRARTVALTLLPTSTRWAHRHRASRCR